MKKDDYKTTVVFRKYRDGEIIALFPYDIYNYRGNITSYLHVGQHGEAEYSHCIRITKPATEEDFKGLKEELESIGYNLEVIKKANTNTYLVALKESLK